MSTLRRRRLEAGIADSREGLALYRPNAPSFLAIEQQIRLRDAAGWIFWDRKANSEVSASEYTRLVGSLFHSVTVVSEPCVQRAMKRQMEILDLIDKEELKDDYGDPVSDIQAVEWWWKPMLKSWSYHESILVRADFAAKAFELSTKVHSAARLKLLLTNLKRLEALLIA